MFKIVPCPTMPRDQAMLIAPLPLDIRAPIAHAFNFEDPELDPYLSLAIDDWAHQMVRERRGVLLRLETR